MKLNTNAMEALVDRSDSEALLTVEDPSQDGMSAATDRGFMEIVADTVEAVEAAEAVKPATAKEGQLELGLRAAPGGVPRRVVRARRYAVARWWFDRMRETVRSTREWHGSEVRRAGTEQALLTLTQPPTRFEGRRAA